MAKKKAAGEPAALGASSELRRSVGQATERIHEIIDAAERVAVEIRSDAETEAAAYLAERREEADRLAGERTAALDDLTRKLADSAEHFKHQAEQMLGDLDKVIVEARAGVYRNGALAAVDKDPEPELSVAEPERRAFERLREPEPEPEPAREPERPVLSAYPGADADDDPDAGDATAEALLRATQMAVTGKGRDDIIAVLHADFPRVDADTIADEILG